MASATATSATAASAAPADLSGGAAMFRWLLAWAVVLMLAGLANRSRVGHMLLYYLMVLALVFLIVTQYRWFANALAPITGLSQTPAPAPAA